MNTHILAIVQILLWCTYSLIVIAAIIIIWEFCLEHLHVTHTKQERKHDDK